MCKTKKINLPVYLSAGQETIPASLAQICFNKKISPLLFGQHRCHSIYLSFGGPINKLILELLGSRNGCTNGMGGSASIHCKKINMFGHDVIWEHSSHGNRHVLNQETNNCIYG